MMHVSSHAIQRFRERTGCTRSDQYVINKILKMLTRSTRAKGKWNRDKDYECEETYYYYGWIIGIANQRFITTIFFDKGRKYEDSGVPYRPWFLR